MHSPSASSISAHSRGLLYRDTNRARVIFFSAIAHVPAVALLVFAYVATSMVFPMCNMQLLFSDASEPSCMSVLTTNVALLCVAVGIVSWRIGHELKLVCWEIVTLVARALGLGSLRLGAADDVPFERPYTVAIATPFIVSIVCELIRLFGFELCVAVVIAIAWGTQEVSHVHVSTMMAQCWLGIDDPRFIVALWIGSGWSIAEVASGSWQMVRLLPLLQTVDDLLPQLEEDILEDYITEPSGHLGIPQTQRSRSPGGRAGPSRSPSPSENYQFNGSECTLEENAEMSMLLLIREKEELEDQLGEPLENLSPATVSLWRIDSVLWQLGSTLVIAATVALAQGCADLSSGDSPLSYPFLLFPSLGSMVRVFSMLVLLHTLVTASWMILLPRVGATTITYLSLLLGLGLLSAGLARWGAVV